jgi:hypothetical protein
MTGGDEGVLPELVVSIRRKYAAYSTTGVALKQKLETNNSFHVVVE